MALALPTADGAVIAEVKLIIERIHERRVPYAELFCPMTDEAFAETMQAFTIRPLGGHLGTVDVEAVSPPVYGRYLFLYSTDVDMPQRRFALRHGTAHVIGGHVNEVSYLSNRNDFTTHEERVADLFALADLVPWYLLDELRH